MKNAQFCNFNTLKALVSEAWLSTVVQLQELLCVLNNLRPLTNRDTLSCSPKLAFKAALIFRYENRPWARFYYDYFQFVYLHCEIEIKPLGFAPKCDDTLFEQVLRRNFASINGANGNGPFLNKFGKKSLFFTFLTSFLRSTIPKPSSSRRRTNCRPINGRRQPAITNRRDLGHQLSDSALPIRSSMRSASKPKPT